MNSTTTLSHNNLLTKELFLNFLIACGLFSSIIYIAADIIASIQWDSYNYSAQGISELMAIEAPTRPLLVFLFTINNLLTLAFGYGILKIENSNKALRITGVLIIIYSVIGLIALHFTPMHSKGIGAGTLTDMLHIIFTFTLVVIMFTLIGFGAFTSGKKFKIYSIATILLIIGFGIIAGAQAPKIAANQPTPGLGILERINIYSYMLWIAVFSVMLMRREKES